MARARKECVCIMGRLLAHIDNAKKYLSEGFLSNINLISSIMQGNSIAYPNRLAL
jgi:hypothetical protein